MDEKSKLDRIILIGNGFDRSLGMPTSYSHFLDWIFQKTLEDVVSNIPIGIFYDTHEFHVQNDLFKIRVNYTTSQWIKKFVGEKRDYAYFLEESKRLSQQSLYKFDLIPKHNFIADLFSFYGQNLWVDIEQLFFETLLKTDANSIIGFNESFETIKAKLVEYLKSIQNTNLSEDVFNQYRNHFYGKILKYNSAYQSYEQSENIPDLFYFVIFNYTNFLRELMDFAPTEFLNRTVFNNIHGDMKDYPIIFGYGNETGENYSRLENLGNDFLENIKSTNYFNSTHYRDLITQLNQPYEVYVYGLSCGLSDQILLNTIMQKKNCKQIRIFYKKDDDGKDNYRETLMNISRVFDDKEMMRSKIIPKQSDDFIRQII